MTYEDTEEQPLDPAMERVRKKMIRLMVISIGIMMVGLLAVLFAIIYKFTNPTKSPENVAESVPGQVAEINLGLPRSANVLSTDLKEDRVLIDVELPDGARQLILVDANTGELISRINVK